jgi:hypothetical protein
MGHLVLPISLLMIVSVAGPSQAAVPPSKKVIKPSMTMPDSEVVMALRLPMENRLMALNHRPNSFEALKKMSFDSKQSLQMRWRALTAMARLDFNRARPALEAALQSSQWFMRNAALVTLVPGDKNMALDWSMKLLKDPALVVRTAAAENLRQLRDRRARESLLRAFQSAENFKGKQSLWVRHYIARALAEMAVPGEESFLVGLLHDQDARVHPWAILGLERLTGQSLSADRDLMKNRNLWLAWWSDRQG